MLGERSRACQAPCGSCKERHSTAKREAKKICHNHTKLHFQIITMKLFLLSLVALVGYTVAQVRVVVCVFELLKE